MVYFIVLLLGASASLLVLALGELVASRPRAISRQLAALEQRRTQQASAGAGRAETPQRERIAGLLNQLGSSVGATRRDSGSLRQLLVRAGYRHEDAVKVFWGARVVLMGGLAAVCLLLASLAGAAAAVAFLGALWGAAVGWLAPSAYLRQRVRARQSALLRGVPDALDLLVVCVEAGLGLNQALARVADEIRHFNRVTGEEFRLVSLEIRAGAPREVALRNLGERAAVPELRSLAGMLVQTDRFGTSIAQALRVHAESLRSSRRQRMEEMAAKTTVKLIFPLVLCIFPAVFVVVLGPAVIRMVRALSSM